MVAHVCELVGDLSQAIEESSYNEDTIRRLWNEGVLNDEAAMVERNNPEGFKAQMGSNYREDGDYQSLLTKEIKRAQFWPTEWRSSLDKLTAKEKALCGLDDSPSLMSLEGVYRLSSELIVNGQDIIDAMYEEYIKSPLFKEKLMELSFFIATFGAYSVDLSSQEMADGRNTIFNIEKHSLFLEIPSLYRKLVAYKVTEKCFQWVVDNAKELGYEASYSKQGTQHWFVVRIPDGSGFDNDVEGNIT